MEIIDELENYAHMKIIAHLNSLKTRDFINQFFEELIWLYLKDIIYAIY